MGRKFGVSFSWKRAVGISAAKGKIARATGIPTTRSGRQRKAGAALGGLGWLFLGGGRRAAPARKRTAAARHDEHVTGNRFLALLVLGLLAGAVAAVVYLARS